MSNKKRIILAIIGIVVGLAMIIGFYTWFRVTNYYNWYIERIPTEAAIVFMVTVIGSLAGVLISCVSGIFLSIKFFDWFKVEKE